MADIYIARCKDAVAPSADLRRRCDAFRPICTPFTAAFRSHPTTIHATRSCLSPQFLCSSVRTAPPLTCIFTRPRYNAPVELSDGSAVLEPFFAACNPIVRRQVFRVRNLNVHAY